MAITKSTKGNKVIWTPQAQGAFNPVTMAQPEPVVPVPTAPWIPTVDTSKNTDSGVWNRPTEVDIRKNAIAFDNPQTNTAPTGSLGDIVSRLVTLDVDDMGNPTGLTLPDGRTVNPSVLAELYRSNPTMWKRVMTIGVNGVFDEGTSTSSTKELDDLYAAMIKYGATPDEARAAVRKQLGLDGGAGGSGGISPLAAWQLRSQQWEAGLPYMVNNDAQWQPGWEPGGPMEKLYSFSGTPFTPMRPVWAPAPGQPGALSAAPVSTPVSTPAQSAQPVVTPNEPVTAGTPLPNGVSPMSPESWALLQHLQKGGKG